MEKDEFGLSDRVFYRKQNTLINTYFNVLKYIKKIFKTPTSLVYFKCLAYDSKNNQQRI